MGERVASAVTRVPLRGCRGLEQRRGSRPAKDFDKLARHRAGRIEWLCDSFDGVTFVQ
jgi:hypothetical protein